MYRKKPRYSKTINWEKEETKGSNNAVTWSFEAIGHGLEKIISDPRYEREGEWDENTLPC